VQLAAFELHLLFVELVLDDVRASLAARATGLLLLSLLLVIDLAHGDRDGLAIVDVVLELRWVICGTAVLLFLLWVILARFFSTSGELAALALLVLECVDVNLALWLHHSQLLCL
tara:strand:+ start:1792 stop:2136 length:345 start_codon:yes stop_codon:yes gene_type:complete